MIAPLERAATNPLIHPSQITFMRVTGSFNPGAAVDVRTNRVVLLVRLYEEETRRSCLGLALSSDGIHIDEIWDRPAVAREAPYEEWGVEDARITWLESEERYAITYTGYSADGPRVCLITTDDLLAPEKVLYVSDAPALTPEAPYEIELGRIPQVDPANFRTGVRVVFPQGLVERGDDLIVYYGAADVSVAAARVNKRALVASLREAIAGKRGGTPL